MKLFKSFSFEHAIKSQFVSGKHELTQMSKRHSQRQEREKSHPRINHCCALCSVCSSSHTNGLSFNIIILIKIKASLHLANCERSTDKKESHICSRSTA